MRLVQVPSPVNVQRVQIELRQKIEAGFDLITDIFQNHYEDDYNKIIPEVIDLVLKEKFELDKSLFEKGLRFAIKKHIYTKPRDIGVSYVVHPVQSAYLMASWGRSDSAIISTLFHDVVEEAEDESLLAEIKQEFSSDISEEVNALTIFEEDRSKRDKKLARKILNHVKESSNDNVIYMKLADVITNMYTLSGMGPKGGLTAEERKAKYVSNVKEFILPFARYVDNKNELDLRIVKYINHLAKR